MQHHIVAMALATAVLGPPLPAQAPVPAPAGYQQLVADYDAAVAASKSGFVVKPVDTVAFARRALALAEQCTGDERVPLLTWAALHAGKDPAIAAAAVTAVRDGHAGSARLTDLLQAFPDLAKLLEPALAKEFLGAIVAQNQHPEPRALALYHDAKRVQADRSASAEQKAAAAAQLAEAQRLAAGTTLAELVAGAPAERLKIGAVAPDIDGKDTDGVEFKLSDYRGKVVVLDFWGFW